MSQANLVATGTNDGYVAPECPPVASFSLAAGTKPAKSARARRLMFNDYSYNYTSGGGFSPMYTLRRSPAARRLRSPLLRLRQRLPTPTPGIYSVTLTVSNSVGNSNSTTQSNVVLVEGPAGGETAPYSQSFEDPNFPNPVPGPEPAQLRVGRHYQCRVLLSIPTAGRASPPCLRPLAPAIWWVPDRIFRPERFPP